MSFVCVVHPAIYMILGRHILEKLRWKMFERFVVGFFFSKFWMCFFFSKLCLQYLGWNVLSDEREMKMYNGWILGQLCDLDV